MKRSTLLEAFGPFLGLAFIIGLFALLVGPRFISTSNLTLVAVQTVVVALGAMGMTLVIISGGIDLSVGSMIALTTVVTALGLQSGFPVLPAAGLGMAAGGLCGLVNGLLITQLRIVPFIVTLGMLGMARGAAKYLAGEQKVDAPLTWLNKVMYKTPEPSWLLLSPGIWIMILLALAVWFLLRYTILGRHTFAIGSSEATARLCGVRVERVKVILYILCGLFTGLAGVMQFARLSVGDPTVAVGRELDIIAAVVIGGGSLSGGEGSVLGSLVGAFLMAFLRSGCTMMGFPNYIQDILVGAIIIIAAGLDQLRRRR